VKLIKVTCIIPSLCSKKSLPNIRTCINSLLTSYGLNHINLKTIVVTNGENIILSGVRNKIDKLIFKKRPFSFAEMNNLAIDYTLHNHKPDWVLLINDDAWVDKNFFWEFLKNLKQGQNEIIVPLIYSKNDKEIDSYGVEYFNSGYAKNSKHLSIKTSLASAACILIQTNFLIQIKERFKYYLNPLLKSYFEDVEFCIRVIAMGGSIKKVKKMVVYHLGSSSSGRRSRYVVYYSYRNTLWVVILTWPLKHIAKNLLNIIIVQCWFYIYGTFSFGILFWPKIWLDTLINLVPLIKERRRILASYPLSVDFGKITGRFTFRFRNGAVF